MYEAITESARLIDPNGSEYDRTDELVKTWAAHAETELLGKHDLLGDPQYSGLVGEVRRVRVPVFRAHRAAPRAGGVGFLLLPRLPSAPVRLLTVERTRGW